MDLDYECIRYKNHHYAVICVKYKDIDLPAVIDWENIKILKKLNKNWKSTHGFVSCSHTYKNCTKEIFLHEIIMALKQQNKGKTAKDLPIIHINRIGFDNRKENLIYDAIDKKIHKTTIKKKRTIKLPNNSGIDPNEIPTYVWYMKPNGTHGERFSVKIGNIKWKTTSKKNLSLRYKLEEAKMYLRQLKKLNPTLFEDYSMNGDFTKNGKMLLDDYYNIVQKAGYKHIKKNYENNINKVRTDIRKLFPIIKNDTDRLLKSGKQNVNEIKLLKLQGNLLETGKRRRIYNLPPNCNIKADEIPNYCFYRPKYRNRGDFFIVKNHPNQNGEWSTTTSKKLSIDDKLLQAKRYIKFLDNNSDENNYDSNSYDSDSYDSDNYSE